MPVTFDYICSECKEDFEALTMSVDKSPKKCKKCGSETASFERKIAAPIWIEGDTPGSKPRPLKEAYNSPREMLQGHNDR